MGVKGAALLEVDSNLLDLVDVQEEVIIAAPHGNVADILPVAGLI